MSKSQEVSEKTREEVAKAANRLHHLSMMYVGSIAELAKGEKIFGLADDHPGLKHVRDLIDQVLFVRSEVNAMTMTLINAGLIDPETYAKQQAENYEWFAQQKAGRFGCTVTDYGLSFTDPRKSQN